MILIRVILICLIIYLVVRSFVRYAQYENEINDKSADQNKPDRGKKISREIGEYIDYEEVDKKE